MGYLRFITTSFSRAFTILGFSGTKISPDSFGRCFGPWIRSINTSPPQKPVHPTSEKVRKMLDEMYKLPPDEFKSLTDEIWKRHLELQEIYANFKFNLKMERVKPDCVQAVIKVLREEGPMEMEDAVKFIETAPCYFMRNVIKAKAEKFTEKMKEAGAIVRME